MFKRFYIVKRLICFIEKMLLSSSDFQQYNVKLYDQIVSLNQTFYQIIFESKNSLTFNENFNKNLKQTQKCLSQKMLNLSSTFNNYNKKQLKLAPKNQVFLNKNNIKTKIDQILFPDDDDEDDDLIYNLLEKSI